MSLFITNIQRMCFSDGPGIRTTVFLKGCSIHCPWCANPENIDRNIESYFYEGYQIEYGKEYEIGELFSELMKDRPFWRYEGGVTFSGGEALLQITDLIELFDLLKKEQINMALETSLFVSTDSIKNALPYIDLFIVDVKILDEKECRQILGGNLPLFYDNLKLIADFGKRIIFRVPCTKEYTFDPNMKDRYLDLFGRFPQYPVEIFKLHNLARTKYKIMNKNMWQYEDIKDDILDRFIVELESVGCDASILRI